MKLRAMAAAFVVAGLVSGTLALAQDKPQGVQVVGADLAKMYEPPLMTEGHNYVSGASFSLVLLRGGIINLVYANRFGTGGHLEGKWRLANETVCFTFPMGNPPTEQCVRIFKQDDGSYQGWSAATGNRVTSFRARRPE